MRVEMNKKKAFGSVSELESGIGWETPKYQTLPTSMGWTQGIKVVQCRLVFPGDKYKNTNTELAILMTNTNVDDKGLAN